MSAQTYNLLREIPEMLRMGIDIIRISPQPQHTATIVAAFDAARRGASVEADTTGWSSEGMVDGYWFGEPGIVQHHQSTLAQLQGAQG
jgi:collagenase-like PrtC family protease